MAKEEKEFSFNDLNKAMSKFSKYGDTMDNCDISDIDEYISTGNYMLNAALMGDILGGVPNNRSIVFSGETGVGKTFLLMNLCKQAQKQNYYIVYYDSENAVDKSLLKKFEIDMTKFRYEPVNTVQEFRSNITSMLDTLIEQKENKVKIPKILICLDSAGNLATQKEVDDAKSQSGAADMTRAKVIKSIFRIIMTKLAVCHIPIAMSNHVYSSQSFIPQDIQSGGSGVMYSASIIINMTKAKLKEGTEQTGIVVSATSSKNRFCKPKKVKFHISYNKGMNPYVGLEDYISWDNCGVERGKFITEKEYDKLTDSEQMKCRKDAWVDDEGEHLQYFMPMEKGKFICCQHLHEGVALGRLFTKQVFSDDVLSRLQPIIRSSFVFDVDGEQQDLDTFIDDEIGEED